VAEQLRDNGDAQTKNYLPGRKRTTVTRCPDGSGLGHLGMSRLDSSTLQKSWSLTKILTLTRPISDIYRISVLFLGHRYSLEYKEFS